MPSYFLRRRSTSLSVWSHATSRIRRVSLRNCIPATLVFGPGAIPKLCFLSGVWFTTAKNRGIIPNRTVGASLFPLGDAEMFGLTLPDTFWVGFAGTVIFGLLGNLFLLVGFLVFDKILPKVDFQESMKANPMAAAVIVAAYFLGLSHIIASVVH